MLWRRWCHLQTIYGPFHSLTLLPLIWIVTQSSSPLLRDVSNNCSVRYATQSESSALFLIILCGFQMLQCIIGMVDKTKRAVSVLQQRCGQDREELLAWARKTAEETEAEVKRRAGMCSISPKWSGQRMAFYMRNHGYHNFTSLILQLTNPYNADPRFHKKRFLSARQNSCFGFLWSSVLSCNIWTCFFVESIQYLFRFSIENMT